MSRGARLAAGVAAFVGTGIGLVTAAVIALAVLASGLRLDFGDGGDPGKGDHSEQLAVEVAPAEGLTDGATVFVSSTAFRPQGIVGVTVCLEESLTEREGVEACDVDGGQRFATSVEGELAAVVPVPRVVTVGGVAHDCASRAGRCLLVAADSADFDLSGGRPLSFAPDLPPVDLVATDGRPRTVLLPGSVDPEGPVAAGTPVTVEATGFMPGEPILVGRCTDAFLEEEVWLACTPAGPEPGAAVTAIMGRSVDQITLHADAEGAVRVEVVVEDEVVPGLGGDDGTGTDCTVDAGACAVVVAAAADTQRSAYLPVAITG